MDASNSSNDPLLNALRHKNNSYGGNNMGLGMNMNNINNMNMMGAQPMMFGQLPNVNGINPNFNFNGNYGNNLMNNFSNVGMMNANTLSNNLSFQQQGAPFKNNIINNGNNAPNGNPPVTQYNFKQKDPRARNVQNPSVPQTAAPPATNVI
jgi:hypothetical protein